MIMCLTIALDYSLRSTTNYRRSVVLDYRQVATHFQLVYVFFQLPFDYPRGVKVSTGPIGFVSGFFFEILTDWAQPECTGVGSDSYSFLWIATAVGPLFLLLPFVLRAYSFHRRQEAIAQSDKAKKEEDRILSLDDYNRRVHIRYWKQHACQNALIVQTLIFMHGVSMSIGIWNCREFPDGSLRLDQYPAIECEWSGDAEYRALLTASIFVFVVYFVGSVAVLAWITESSEGRRAAANHHVGRFIENSLRATSLSSWMAISD